MKNLVLVIHAWAWDWNGTEIFRNMFKIEIGAYSGQKSPTELSCYPATFYIGSGDERGTSAVYENAVYKNRQENYVKFTFQQKPPAKRLLRYSGEFRGIPAFSDGRLSLMNGTDNEELKHIPYVKVSDNLCRSFAER